MDWQFQRTLWIGWKQNDCVLHQIPREILHEIIQYCKDPLQDLEKLFISLKCHDEKSYLIVGGINPGFSFLKYDEIDKNELFFIKLKNTQLMKEQETLIKAQNLTVIRKKPHKKIEFFYMK